MQRDNFAQHFVLCGDKVEARRRAQYRESKNAPQLADKLARAPDVQAAIAYHAKRQAKKIDLTGEAILKEISALAYGNMGDFFEVFKSVYDDEAAHQILGKFADLPREHTAAIKKFKFTKKVTTIRGQGGDTETVEYDTELQLYDKWQPLKHLASLALALAPKGKKQDKVKKVKISWNKSQETESNETTTEQDG